MSLFQLFSSFTPDEWEAYSSENIAKAERERKASVALRSEINGILMQTYVDLRNIFETVNNEFSKRIEETVSAKRSLEKELARVTHCFVFYSLYLKAAQHSRRRKPGQNNTLHCYSFNQSHPIKSCTNRLRQYEQSLFFLVRRTKRARIHTRVTEGARRWTLNALLHVWLTGEKNETARSLCTNGQMNNSEIHNRFSKNYRFDQAVHNTDNDILEPFYCFNLQTTLSFWKPRQKVAINQRRKQME